MDIKSTIAGQGDMVKTFQSGLKCLVPSTKLRCHAKTDEPSCKQCMLSLNFGAFARMKRPKPKAMPKSMGRQITHLSMWLPRGCPKLSLVEGP